MKKIATILLTLLITTSVFAQVPQKMSYQAVIRNASNTLVTNTQVGMKIGILQGSASGTIVYTETKTPITNANGLVSIEIGGGAGFNNIDWANGPFYIKTETDPTGGTNYSISGSSQLVSVPYALHAKSANPAPGNTTGDVLVWNGTAWLPTPLCDFFTYYFGDADGDGFGDKYKAVMGCTSLSGYVTDSTDCNDNNALIKPTTVWHLDADNDGFGAANTTLISCTQPLHYVLNGRDCNDTDSNNTTGPLFFIDADGDGFGNPAISINSCTLPTGYVSNSSDCDDNISNITVGRYYYPDADGDGFGSVSGGIFACTAPIGYVSSNTDCDDVNASICPAAPEVCDRVDNNCDGRIDENIDFFTDINNCGSCNFECFFPNAIVACNNMQCIIIACQPGFADANGARFDGCEVDLSTHCVISGQVFPNGTTQPGSPCLICNTSINSQAWTPVPTGTTCPGGVCNGGVCVQ